MADRKVAAVTAPEPNGAISASGAVVGRFQVVGPRGEHPVPPAEIRPARKYLGTNPGAAEFWLLRTSLPPGNCQFRATGPYVPIGPHLEGHSNPHNVSMAWGDGVFQ
jgi:hypothetical protein